MTYKVTQNAVGSYSIIEDCKYDEESSHVVATVYEKDMAGLICGILNKGDV